LNAVRFACLWVLAASFAVPVAAEIVTSDKAEDIAVTVYQDPRRDAGQMPRQWPGGYALITETRTINIPAGDSQIRFENVAEGLLPETAIITGLPSGVREKNRDARLISPAGLVDAYLKRSVRIRRTDRATGKVTESDAIIQAGPNGGVILKTATGFEALRCSGLPERMTFADVPETLTARPTLSVLTRSKSAVTAKIQLTYMAQGFDWSANYIGRVANDGQKMGLFAWLTVANGGSQSFKNARLQVIAGKPNKRENNQPPPPPRSSLDLQCWPLDVTSTHPVTEFVPIPLPPGPDLSQFNDVGRNPPGTGKKPKKSRKLRQRGGVSYNDIVVTAQKRTESLQSVPVSVSVLSSDMLMPAPPPPPAEFEPESVTIAQGATAQQENLGDLKLYRVPMRVTVAALSQKQVAMINQPAAAITRVYIADGTRYRDGYTRPLPFILRARNVKEAGLGLPLPAGSLALFESGLNRSLFSSEHDVSDLAIGETFEIEIGESPDVQWWQTQVNQTDRKQGWVVTVTNARAVPVRVEIIVPGDLIDPPAGLVRGLGGWVLPLDVPANERATLTYRLKSDG
jgi:hypothetical protein